MVFLADHDKKTIAYRVAFHSRERMQLYNGVDFNPSIPPKDFPDFREAVTTAHDWAHQEATGTDEYNRVFTVVRVESSEDKISFDEVARYTIIAKSKDITFDTEVLP